MAPYIVNCHRSQRKGAAVPIDVLIKVAADSYGRGKTKEEMEKAVQNTGGLEMAFLEKNMIWINSVITIAPMLGFTGTVVGMIKAFEDIKMANDISPAVVAGGISQALLTTAFGLIVAMIMQVAQNFFVSMIDKLILDMEEQSIKIVEYLHSSKK